MASNGSGPPQEERIVAVAGAAGVELAVAPPCNVTVPGAGSEPPGGTVNVTRSPNGLAAPVSIVRVTLFWLFVQLAVRVNVVAGAGSGTTLTLILAASAASAESTAATVKAVLVASAASGTA